MAPAFGEDDLRGRPEREGAAPVVQARCGDDGTLRRPRCRRAVRRPLRQGRRQRRSRGPAERGCCLVEQNYATTIRSAGAAETPLIQYARPAWYIRTTAVKDRRSSNEHDQLAARAHQGRPLRRTSREQRRLGALARALLGHAAADLALRERPREGASAPRRARRARRPRPVRASTRTVLRSTRSTFSCPECGETATRVPR